MRATVLLLILLNHCVLSVAAARAEVVGYLTSAREAGANHFETDLFLFGSADRVGSVIEWINLDIANSTVAGQPLTEYSRVVFGASPAFQPWAAGESFGSGDPGFESQISLDSFAPSAAPYPIDDTDPFRIGTFRFDYAGIVLQPGETIRLDIAGRDDGTPSQTTSIAVRGTDQVTRLFDLPFESPFGSSVAEFSDPTVIPEPGVAVWLTVVLGVAWCGRRRRSRSWFGTPPLGRFRDP